MTMQLLDGQLLTRLVPDAAELSTARSTIGATHSRDVFTSLTWALSYPGRCYPLLNIGRPLARLTPTQQSCLLIGEALLDLETSFFTPDPELGQRLAHTSARWTGPQEAAYHFYPDGYHFYPELALTDSPQGNLASVRQAHVRATLYPDQSTTLVIACEFGRGGRLLLAGPGIPGRSALLVAGIPQAFWQLRAETNAYPLGWDIFLVDGDQVVGLPRTTVIMCAGA